MTGDWLRRVWLWARRKPVPTYPAQLSLPNATVRTPAADA